MNQQYVFYNEYYQNEGKNYSNCNDMLTVCAKYVNSDEGIPLTEQSFVLKTLYPGLLSGTGYNHQGGDIVGGDQNEEIKLGFSFDYVTGLPYVPGSSIKGVLKSQFEKYESDIAKMLDCQVTDVRNLSKSIFGDSTDTGVDIFLDTIPVEGCEDGHVLGIDYITPHKSKDGPAFDEFASPNPIRMLKIIPDVKMLFRFILKDSVVGDVCLRADVKLELFKELIKTYGVGAKTNVGYGRFEDAKNDEGYFYLTVKTSAKSEYTERKSLKKDNGHRQSTNSANNHHDGKNYHRQFIQNEEYFGKVTGHNKTGKFAYVSFENGGNGSFYDGGKIAEETSVILIYLGKNDKGFDTWRMKN